MYKIYLIKINEHKKVLENIFGDIIENVYVEFFVFPSNSKSEIKIRFDSTMFSSSFYSNDFDIESGAVVVEFKNGSLVYFNGNTHGGSVGKYLSEHEKIDGFLEEWRE